MCENNPSFLISVISLFETYYNPVSEKLVQNHVKISLEKKLVKCILVCTTKVKSCCNAFLALPYSRGSGTYANVGTSPHLILRQWLYNQFMIYKIVHFKQQWLQDFRLVRTWIKYVPPPLYSICQLCIKQQIQKSIHYNRLVFFFFY